MEQTIFYVTIRDKYEESLSEFFPYLAPEYKNIARNFKRDKKYPVLSVESITLVGENDTNVDSARFLVPTENGNFLWVLSEIFVFAGMDK
ncbi:MAG: hypothetical protein PQJ60_07510 [Spirochaetales bacterium]|nr:hypothetical protein [Spirochaetales bacterium]